MSDETRQHYDQFAHRYDEIFLSRQRDKILKLAAYVPRPWSTPCLDAGAGTGIAGKVLSHAFVNVDISAAMLSHAEDPRVIADVQNLPFEDEAFGFILCVSVIDHRLDIELSLKELTRVLKTDAYLAISVLKTEDIAHVEWTLMSIFGRLEHRLDLGPDVGFVTRKQSHQERASR